MLGTLVQARAGASQRRSVEEVSNDKSTGSNAMTDNSMADEVVKAKIRRALLSGPDSITREATVADMDARGKMTVLRPAANQWVCVPGNENIIGQPDMCLDPMGMRWLLDLMARKPKPSNAEPGLIYMLNGAMQHSYTDPFDRTSPANPNRPALDDHLAFRRASCWFANRHARRMNAGDVWRHALCAFACLWVAMGRE
jgi:hypothetical protein